MYETRHLFGVKYVELLSGISIFAGDCWNLQVDTAKGVEFKCSVTYFEIYNEVIKDLLCPTSEKLDVRSNPTMGVYVQGLKDVPIL